MSNAADHALPVESGWNANRAVASVLKIHAPIDALMNPGRHERVVKVCTGCGTDDGNFQLYPCPTVRAIERG